jgi:quercetin dioxygenase-like cupin family protein
LSRDKTNNLRVSIQQNKSMPLTHKLDVSAQHRDWGAVPVEDLGNGIERQMIVGERLMICRLRFPPRTVTEPHAHLHEQLTLVERGRVLFIIGEEERVASAGDVLHFPSGCWHGATMLDEEVVLLDIFTPLREDFLKSQEYEVRQGE